MSWAIECWRLGCGRRVLAFGLAFGRREEDEKKAGGLGLAATRFIFSPGRGELSNSTGLRAGSVPGFMLPYPYPVAGDREVETRLRVRVGAGLCQQRVSFSASNPPHFETSKPICATVDILHHFFFYPLSLLYRTTRAPHRAGTRAPGYRILCAVSTAA